MTFYEFVDSILKARGWTRKTLAERAGLNYPAMASAFRRNTKSYPSTNAVAIAKALGLPLRHFFPYIEGAPTFTFQQMQNGVYGENMGREAIDFYDCLDSVLKARGWSRRTLAEHANVNYYSMATAYRRRSSAFPERNVYAIAKALEVPVRIFFPYLSGAPVIQVTAPPEMTDGEAARIAVFAACPVDLNNADEVEFSLSFDEDFTRLRDAYLRLTDKGKLIAADVVCSLVQNRKFQHPCYSTDPQPVGEPKDAE